MYHDCSLIHSYTHHVGFLHHSNPCTYQGWLVTMGGLLSILGIVGASFDILMILGLVKIGESYVSSNHHTLDLRLHTKKNSDMQ